VPRKNGTGAVDPTPTKEKTYVPSVLESEPLDSRLLVVEYLEPGSQGARAWIDGFWGAWLPEPVLRHRWPDSSPPTSGLFLVRGRPGRAAYHVAEVLCWQPIMGPSGAVLRSEWPVGAAAPRLTWQAQEREAGDER
jgi:hypothetical protein